MKKKVFYLIFPILTLILELLPYGAVCNFASGPNEIHRETFSYFDLVPFGYANFAPLLTAITTCAILALLVVHLFADKSGLIKVLKALLLVGTLLSLCPLLYGIRFFSAIGALISLSFAAETVLIFITAKSSNKI